MIEMSEKMVTHKMVLRFRMIVLNVKTKERYPIIKCFELGKAVEGVKVGCPPDSR